MESSAGVSFDAMLLAMAALSLISEPASADAAGLAAVVAGVPEASPLPNHDGNENGLADPALPAVAMEVLEPWRLCDGPAIPKSLGEDFAGEEGAEFVASVADATAAVGGFAGNDSAFSTEAAASSE